MDKDVRESSDRIVGVTGGDIRGSADDKVATFLGIPYGANTGGKNRFRAPQPVDAWPGVRDALRVGNACPQIPLLDSLPIRPDIEAALNLEACVSEGCTDRNNMGEDCLNLNLWAPAKAEPGVRLPVLVWFHGGGLTSGSGNLERTDGYNLAKRGDVVVVSVNHRLGAFGYLHLGGLSEHPEVATSGNNGMLDLVQALQWVRDNIAGFGGDPDRVTIFGYSGGGFKVCALMGMPAANGLFHRAIAQSGFNEGADAATGTAVARRFLTQLGVEPDQIEALREIPAARLVQAQAEIGGVYAGFSAVIDGTILPGPVSESIRAGKTGQVPFIAGFTREEASLFVGHDTRYGRLDWDSVIDPLSEALGDRGRAAAALEVYRSARPDADPTRLWAAILSDQLFGVPGIRMLEAHSAHPNRQSWGYFSTWTSSVLPDMYSGHGIEETLYFDNADKAPATRDAPDGAELGRKLGETWVTFARNGDPHNALLPDWPRYEASDRRVLVIDTPCTVARDPFAAEYRFWSESAAMV